MSLKAFHIVFISLAILLSIGCSVWAFVNEVERSFAFGSAIIAIALIAYEIVFLKKAKRIIT